MCWECGSGGEGPRPEAEAEGLERGIGGDEGGAEGVDGDVRIGSGWRCQGGSWEDELGVHTELVSLEIKGWKGGVRGSSV